VKFLLIDKIEHLDDQKIVAIKSVSLAEEYLADHFPSFPVLPGVMMVEALTQAAGWLLHHRTRFGKSMVVLKEARNIRYGQFVAPGDTLRVEVEYFKSTDAGASFKVVGTVNSEQSLSGRIELAYFNLAEKNPEMASLDEKIRKDTQERWNVLQAQSAVKL
jgi:3-hydroxyacyl-[acyl-carrier-protein] dehydratase